MCFGDDQCERSGKPLFLGLTMNDCWWWSRQTNVPLCPHQDMPCVLRRFYEATYVTNHTTQDEIMQKINKYDMTLRFLNYDDGTNNTDCVLLWQIPKQQIAFLNKGSQLVSWYSTRIAYCLGRKERRKRKNLRASSNNEVIYPDGVSCCSIDCY